MQRSLSREQAASNCRGNCAAFRKTKELVIRWLAGGLVAIGLVVLVAAFYPNGAVQNRGPADVIGTAAPSFTVPLVGGGMLNLQSLRGKPVLLNVWATWCGPCRREMPALERLAREERNRLTVVAVDQGEDSATAEAYARRFGVTFPVAVDANQRLGTVLHLAGLPSSFFIDRRGVIRDAVDGEMTFDTMRSRANALTAGS